MKNCEMYYLIVDDNKQCDKIVVVCLTKDYDSQITASFMTDLRNEC